MDSAAAIPKNVSFSSESGVLLVPWSNRARRSTLNMDIKIYEKCDGASPTDEMLEGAATLFSENYGVWSEQAATHMGRYAKAGMPETLD
jgi:hypothetical protein